MAFGYRRTLTVSAASTNGVAASQTPSGAADLTLASTIVTLPNTGQRPQLISLADLSNRTFTFYGTEPVTGRTQTYAMTGPNATTKIAGVSFATITRIAISGAAAGALTAGWAAQADLGPCAMDLRMNPTDIAFACIIDSGTPTYTARFTMDDIYADTYDPGLGKWWDHPIVVSQTADNTGNYGKPVSAIGLYASGVCVMRLQVVQGVGLN
jgi:hypothetical protein